MLKINLLILRFIVIAGISIQLTASTNVPTGGTKTLDNITTKTGGGELIIANPQKISSVSFTAGMLSIQTSNLGKLNEVDFNRDTGNSTPTSGSNLPQVLETTQTLTLAIVKKNGWIPTTAYKLDQNDIVVDTSYKIDSSHGPVEAPVGAVVYLTDTLAPRVGTKLTITSLLGTGDLNIGKADFPIYIEGANDPTGIRPSPAQPSYPAKGQTGSVEVLSALPAGNYTVTDGTFIPSNASTNGAAGSITVESGAALDCATHQVKSAALPSGQLTLRSGGTIILGDGVFDKAVVLN